MGLYCLCLHGVFFCNINLWFLIQTTWGHCQYASLNKDYNEKPVLLGKSPNIDYDND
jgi:hypothetical protein